MNDVSLAVEHDVSIVSVLDLQEECDDTVGGHAHYEVPPGLSGLKVGGVSKFESTNSSSVL